MARPRPRSFEPVLGLTPESIFCRVLWRECLYFRVEGGCVCGSERQSVGPQDRGGQQRRMRTRLLWNPSWGLSGGEQVAPFGEGSGSWKQVSSCMRNWHYSVLWVLTPFGCNCHFSVPEGKSWRADPGCPGIPALSRCPVSQEGFGIENKLSCARWIVLVYCSCCH